MNAVVKSLVRKFLHSVRVGDILSLSLIALTAYPIIAIGFGYLPKSAQDEALSTGYYLLVVSFGSGYAMRRKLRKCQSFERSQIDIKGSGE